MENSGITDQNDANSALKALIRGVWVAIRGERPRFALFTVLFLIANCLDLAVPWAIGYALGAFVQFGGSAEAFHQAVYGVAAYTALRLGYTVFHHFARYVQNTVAYSARMNVIEEVFTTLVRFPLRWHVGHHSGENLSRLHRSAGAIDGMVGTYVWQIIEGSTKVIFAGLALFALDFWVATNVLVMAGVTIAAMIMFNRSLTRRIRRNNAFHDKINRICVDYLSNIVTVKTLGVEESAERHMKALKPEGLKISQSISAFMELKWGATGLGYAIVISTSLLIYFYGHSSAETAFDVAQVYVLLNYLDRIFQAIGSFTGYYSGIVEASTAYEDATRIFDQAATFPKRSSTTAPDDSWKTLTIEGLNFSYTESEKTGLRDINLSISHGEKIALVGQSGSGKSTLLKIFGGLLVPGSGTLSNDSTGEIAFGDIVPHCLLLPQEPEIFSGTMLFNFTLGEDFDMREITFYISLCKLDGLVDRLPEGIHSNLAEKGLNLSVGERQRIALARGLLRAGRRGILLLDEPTSSLDTKNEKEIHHGLLYHFADRTIISSCHRLHLIPLFDRVIVMSSGEIVEQGTFAELIDRKGTFFRAWEDYQRNMKDAPTGQNLEQV